MPICEKAAVIVLRRQHVEIERLNADADRVNSYAKNLAIAMHRKNFSNITQWEPLPDTMGLISQIDNMSCWHDAEIERLTAINAALTEKGNSYVIENARQAEEIERLIAERDEAIANASALTQHLTRVIGDHCAPSDCFSSGPMFGDARDAVCPACAALHFLSNPRASVDSGRDAAIAAAVAAEREACAAVCIAQADRLEGPSDACGIALVCAGMIRARTKP